MDLWLEVIGVTVGRTANMLIVILFVRVRFGKTKSEEFRITIKPVSRRYPIKPLVSLNGR